MRWRIGVVLVFVAGLLLAGVLWRVVQARHIRSDQKNRRIACFHLRDAVDQFTADKKTAPQSLEEIVQAGYLRDLPKGVSSLDDCVLFDPDRLDPPLPTKDQRIGLLDQRREFR